MEKKRPIDAIRDGAVSMHVGGPDDVSAITAMVPIGKVLHFVKEKGIYACQLADAIDPGRTNPHVPNVQQKVLSLGSDSPIVGRTLLTARELFQRNFLPASFDCTEGVTLSFSALKDLAAMHAMLEQVRSTQASAQWEDRTAQDRSLVLPSLGEAAPMSKSFIQKADHALQALHDIVKLFYGRGAGKGGWEALAERANHQYGGDDPFFNFLNAAMPLLRFVRNARNCVEHPRPEQRIVVTDFALNSAMQVTPPMLEVIHPKSPQPPVAIETFMQELTEQIPTLFEVMLAHLCSKHALPIGGFPLQVTELPESGRRYKQVRFSYATLDGIPVLSSG